MKMAIIERSDGSITIKKPGPAQLEMDDTEFTAFVTSEMSKRPAHFAGATVRLVGDDVDLIPTLPWGEPFEGARQRRSSARWNGTALFDDQEITTDSEVALAVELAEEGEITTPGNSQKSRKLQQGKKHLLTDIELDQIVSDWRGSRQAPPGSDFTPPPGRKPPPKPRNPRERTS
tara:strand:- start:50 stop:574 length:525 start_codon:yes stop_codon:yes gene_type:complete